MLTADGPGHKTATVAGTIMAPTGSKPDEDVFQLGRVSAGTVVELNAAAPSTSTLTPKVTLVDANGAALADEDGNPDNGHVLTTIPTGGDYYAKIELGDSGTPGPWAQYVLSIDLADLTPPQVTAASPLPDNNGSTDGLIDRLTMTTSKDLDLTTVVGGLDANVTYFGGHYYLLTPAAMNWHDAEAYAQSVGGHWRPSTTRRRTISSRTPMLRPRESVWIGLTDEASEGNFVWSSDPTHLVYAKSSDQSFSYTNWNPGEPNNANGGENYVEMSGGAGWNDWNGANAIYAVVEFNSLPSTSL